MQHEPLISKGRKHEKFNVLTTLSCFLFGVIFVLWVYSPVSRNLEEKVSVNPVEKPEASNSNSQDTIIHAESSERDYETCSARASQLYDEFNSDGASSQLERLSLVGEEEYDWRPLVQTYINTWMKVTWDEGRVYTLNENPKVGVTNCKQAPDCRTFCLQASRSSVRPSTQYCENTSTQCYDTSKIQCWRYVGAGLSFVWDGWRKWTVRIHARDLGDYNNHAFLILSKEDTKEVAYIFGPGGGAGKQIHQLCGRMHERCLDKFIERIPEDYTVYIMGHSEGSGWALCMDEYMKEKKMPQRRVLLATAPRLIPPNMLNSIISSPRPYLFLIAGLLESPKHGISMFDLFTFQGAIPTGYRSPPALGFTCTRNYAQFSHELNDCIIPDNIDLEEEYRHRLLPLKVGEIHIFDYYIACLSICLKKTFTKDFKFTSNTTPYVVPSVISWPDKKVSFSTNEHFKH